MTARRPCVSTYQLREPKATKVPSYSSMSANCSGWYFQQSPDNEDEQDCNGERADSIYSSPELVNACPLSIYIRRKSLNLAELVDSMF